MAEEHFDRFMGDSDGIMWTIESDPNLRSTITAVFLLDSAPDWDRLRERLERTTHQIPRLRQRVVEVPLRLAPPRWVTDGRFDLDYHARRIVAPAPGDMGRVLRLAESLAGRAFDPERPLWESVLCEGLEGGRAALVLKIHHSVTDGIGGMRLLHYLVDLEREPSGEPTPAPVAVAEHLSTPALTLDALAHTGRQLTGSARSALGSLLSGASNALRSPAKAATDALQLAGSVGRVLAPITTTMSPLMRDRSLRRRMEVLDVPLDGLRDAAHAAGGTLNDAFVASVSGGLHRYHVEHGDPVPELRVTMPISTRDDADPLGGNRIMPARFPIPVAIQDPAERIRRVGEVCHAWRREPALPLTDALATLLEHLPGRLTTGVFGGMLEHIDFLTTNVPGSPVALFLCGTSVERIWALAPTMGSAVNVALLSYAGTCGVGIVTDLAAVPDADVLLRCMRESFDEVLALAPQPVRSAAGGEDRPALIGPGGPAMSGRSGGVEVGDELGVLLGGQRGSRPVAGVLHHQLDRAGAEGVDLLA